MHTIKASFILLVLALPATLILLQSCGGRVCSCEIQCQYFNGDSIKICSSSYPSDSAFEAAIDTAAAHYGSNITDTLINYHSFNYNASEVSQLESHGYVCNCFDNGW